MNNYMYNQQNCHGHGLSWLVPAATKNIGHSRTRKREGRSQMREISPVDALTVPVYILYI